MAQRTRIVIESEQVHLLSVSGALDREGLRKLRKHLGALHDAGVRLIMADLCRVTSCDGRLFAVLAQSDHLLTRRGGWLRLVGLGPAVLDALDQATLPEVLLVYRASDQASRGVGECTACS
jgi:anti-anti-sigma factor